ncbi:MAG: hypothetical protein MUF49_08565 [Oculatellaceae cyanobacterium Prado106]|nr:hypothetical protein [Oculatellaceae cyanobacterium Prado106]
MQFNVGAVRGRKVVLSPCRALGNAIVLGVRDRFVGGGNRSSRDRLWRGWLHGCGLLRLRRNGLWRGLLRDCELSTDTEDKPHCPSH